jgi:predicted GIY-YIG superfamily endonuclease
LEEREITLSSLILDTFMDTQNPPGFVYLICLNTPLGNAKHYIGWSKNPEGRLFYHRKGTGSKFLRACNKIGIEYDIVKIWAGDRSLERKFKNLRKSASLCPHCKELLNAKRREQYREKKLSRHKVNID